MHLTLKKINNTLFEKSKKYFKQNYTNSLKNKHTFKQSLIARYLISKQIEKDFQIKNYYAKIDNNWIPILENNIYWSISHKKDHIFIWVSKEKIWIDLEILKKRDPSLLEKFKNEEYQTLWEKNWQNFYYLWTAKESIIKKELWNLNNIPEIKIKKYNQINIQKSEIKFCKELFFDFKWKNFKVLSWKNNNLYYSICL